MKLDLYEVTVEKFCGINRTDLSIRYEVDLNSTKKVNCIKNGEDMVDIETMDTYHILKRSSNGITIDPSEKIELDMYYAVNATPCSKSVLQSIRCALADRKVKAAKKMDGKTQK